jgi:hypothetical protein
MCCCRHVIASSCTQKDPALRPNADQLFEHPFIAAAPSSAPPQLLLRIADLGQRRRPVVGGRGSEPGGDYAVSALVLLLLKDLSSSSVKQISCLACQLECLGLTFLRIVCSVQLTKGYAYASFCTCAVMWQLHSAVASAGAALNLAETTCTICLLLLASSPWSLLGVCEAGQRGCVPDR